VKVRFGPYTVDTGARQLTRDGRELRLSPKAFDLLVLLIERRPAVVDKATLRDRLWPATHVVAASLSNLVAEIRALDAGADPLPLRTVHGVGYAFAGDAEELTPAQQPGPLPHAASCWVVWRERPIALAIGENLVGRDSSCAVWLDKSGVSRRHARIRVAPTAKSKGSDAATPTAAATATVEDLNSTNGTFLQGRAVSSAAPLRDGDKLQVGSEVLVFRTRAAVDAPTRRVRRTAIEGN
jgi:DNA-binding winged helix-turn-helix (wHTH) protein